MKFDTLILTQITVDSFNRFGYYLYENSYVWWKEILLLEGKMDLCLFQRFIGKFREVNKYK